MSTIVIVKKAILDMKDRTGSSLVAINKWIESNEKKEIKKHVMKSALAKAVTDGVLVKVKASYKLSPDAKKALTVKKAKKPLKKAVKPKKKTTATKKKTTASKKQVSAKKKLKVVGKSSAKNPPTKNTLTASWALKVVGKSSAKKPKAPLKMKKKPVKKMPKKQ
eukprot:CAMPEP_0168163502 /NCGR_PEP_ID=MMETSP0139_2-20121125/415_1 /TAXON_ID=44445 /ORGANISM="Pseudo-nitzschia australis, Strain 10249 10 AB" /LENGTH=163 /DNA_ID=CAMNT_0008080411 /DNA_START=169 /DNA_END=660 /DNA_ORIENTATION=+